LAGAGGACSASPYPVAEYRGWTPGLEGEREEKMAGRKGKRGLWSERAGEEEEREAAREQSGTSTDLTDSDSVTTCECV